MMIALGNVEFEYCTLKANNVVHELAEMARNFLAASWFDSLIPLVLHTSFGLVNDVIL